MTSRDLVIQILQFGFSTGAVHRYDCLKVFIRAYPGQKEAAIAACAEFERGVCFSREAKEKLSEMTDEAFYQEFVIPYSRELAVV